MPRTDGQFLTDDAQRLVQQGKIADVPVVSGTLLSYSHRELRQPSVSKAIAMMKAPYSRSPNGTLRGLLSKSNSQS